MQGSFVRKRGKFWTAYYYVADTTGQRRQRSKGGFRTKAAANQALNTILADLDKGDYVEPSKLTLGDYLTGRWLPIMRHSLSPTTYDTYERMLGVHVIPRLGSVPLQQLSVDQLDQLYSDLLRDGRHDGTGGLSPRSVRAMHSMLHKALKDAERKQLVQRNVADAADAPKQRRHHEMRTWTAEEVRTFLEGLREHRIHAAYVLSATTGMRRGEVLGLRWRDIDFAGRRLSIQQTLMSVNYELHFGRPKTERSRRSIALDGFTIAVLHAHRHKQADDRLSVSDGFVDRDLAFARPDGGPIHPDYYSQTFNRTVKRLGLPRIRLHDLRHTHATLGLAARVPPKVMSDRLGHATVAFTLDVYTHAIPAMESDAADQVASLIFGNGADGTTALPA